MKPQIIDIKSLLEAKPKYRTWYRYYDDILISVICTNGQKSYVRRKAKSKYLKSDNEMCFWHSDWQYSKIETNYGVEKSGRKTYEIVIQHNNETHRIDSLVDNIAIEFQHTLEVSLNEMNSRFVAHNSVGFIPYLVLDLTSFSLSDILSQKFNFKSIDRNQIAVSKSNDCLYLKTKLKKWYSSMYFKNNNLFIDFRDNVIRLVSKLEKGFIVLEKNFFLNSILALNEDLNQRIEIENEQKQIKEKRLKEEALIEKEREQAELANRYRALCNKNKEDIKSAPEFQFYRQCLNDSAISIYLSKYNRFEFIKYSSFASQSLDLHLKHHIYRFYDSINSIPSLILEYTTFNKNNNNKYDYQYAEILLKRTDGTELRTIRFIKKRGEKTVLHSKRFELIEGFLHSVNNPALIEYNERGEVMKSEYYLFNVRIQPEESWGDLCIYCSYGHFLDSNDANKYENYLKEFKNADKWHFQKYFAENNQCKGNDLMPRNQREEYYKEKRLAKFYMDDYLELEFS